MTQTFLSSEQKKGKNHEILLSEEKTDSIYSYSMWKCFKLALNLSVMKEML